MLYSVSHNSKRGVVVAVGGVVSAREEDGVKEGLCFLVPSNRGRHPNFQVICCP